MCLIPHAGKDPKDNKEYWITFNGAPISPPPGRIILDGGYAPVCGCNDDDCGCEVDGGSSNGRIFKPLI